MRQLENEIEKKLVDQVKKIGGQAFKFISPNHAGIPDRLVILPGNKIGFAEIKRPGGKTRRLQDKQIAFLKSLGCMVWVIDNEEKIDKFIKKLQGGTQTIERDIQAI
nr:MAG TPA: Nuclease [Caudoviricetes sp.]